MKSSRANNRAVSSRDDDVLDLGLDDFMNDGDAPSVAGPSQNVVVSAFGMDPSAPAPLDLFEKFRNKNSMFSDWLLPPEADVNAKPISDDVANKLRARQAAMVSRSAQPLVEGAEDIKSPVTSSTTPTIAAREDAGGFDGDYFSFGPKVLSEKEAVVSKMSSENLQAVVSVAGTSAVQTATTDFRRRRSAVLVPVEIQRTVPLWSLQRFQVAGGYADNALVALHQEILDLVDFLSPSQGEVTLRRYIELEVTKMAKKFWPECEPCVYGSLTTHLLLPLSDIDMSILNVPVSTEEALTALCREVANSKLCSSAYPQLILKTKVPLLKFTHRGSLLDVDVSINAGDGKRNSDIVKGYLEDYPEARPLIIVVKYFLQQRDMHEPYHGGMGSFATTLLVISFLQHHPIYTTRPQDRPHTGLGKLLVDFFRYYGTCFNSHRCGISLENGGFYFIRKQSSAMTDFRGMANQVILEDPGNRSNNAASSLRQFPTIASSFAHAYAALTAVFPLINEGSGMSPDSEHIAGRPTILSRILHIDPSSVARRQCIVETFESYLDDAEMSAVIDVATDYCRAEDAPMLVRSPLSTVQTSQSGKPSASQNSDAPHKGASTSRQSTPLVRGAAEFPTTTDEAPPSASKRQSKRTRQDDDQESSPKEPRAPRRMYQRPNY